MANPINYLIGRGETLVQPISLNTGGGDKAHPYTFEEAMVRLRPEIASTGQSVDELPALACPNDEAVISLTLHPSYLAKSYHPSRLLNGLGLRQVGSRERRVMPAKWTQKEAPAEPLVAPELFIAGDRRKLIALDRAVLETRDEAIYEDFRRIEHISALDDGRVGLVPGVEREPPLEVILHADVAEWWGHDVLRGFGEWCRSLGIDIRNIRRQQAGGLTFLGLHAPRDQLTELSQFAFLRRLRRMPKLAFRDVELRAGETRSSFPVELNNELVVDSELRAAIFDGGLPAKHQFPSFVVSREAAGIGAALPQAVRHGSQVTSAFLYGPLTQGTTLERAYSGVDHWRVIDEDGDDFELMTTLDRIMEVLEQHPYDLVSLSIGPDEALLDHDVHIWTARLDQFAATGRTLVVSAAGNNGSMDVDSGLCRVQPAADGVNVLGVGASDNPRKPWARASYSAKGPGRSPGLVKPDVLAFGGSSRELFYAANGIGTATGVFGTSFAAPAAARLGAGLRALFGTQLSPTALRALLVHHADCGTHDQCDVGWGSLPPRLDDLATCLDDEATVVYQGVLEPARYRRFLLPVPADGFGGMVDLRATLVTATPVDPEDAINYTRTGVSITFRPKTVGDPGTYMLKGELRQRSVHQSASFFGQSAMFQTEQMLRDDAQRWEAVLKAGRRFRASTLDQPVFDVEHQARAHGQGAQRSDTVSYALIVTVREKGATDLYNRVVRSYAGRLEAMRPQVNIPIRTRSS